MLWLLAVLCPVPPVDVPINPVLEVKAELLEGIELRANVPFSIRESRKPGMKNIHVYWAHPTMLHFYTAEWARRRQELEGGPPPFDDEIFERHLEIERQLGNFRIDPYIRRDLPDDDPPLDWWMLGLPLALLVRWGAYDIEAV